MINKLKIIGSATVYSTQNTWETYKNTVSIIRSKILSHEIVPTNVKYSNDFDEKYNPYTSGKNWGSNLDEYILTIDSKLKATISYFNINRYSRFENRDFKFEISFDLPEDLLPLFSSAIEREFYHKCIEIHQQELEIAEENRIKEIGKELLKRK